MKSLSKVIQQIPKRLIWVLLVFFITLLQISTPLVNAQAVTSIPSGLSQEDQDAINGGWVNEVTSSCTSSVSDLTPGAGSSTGAAFPNLDPTSMSNAINTWITQQHPNSELSGLGSTIVADAQHSNVSPFLIVSIAMKESQLADPSDYNTSHGNNAFGRSAAPGQPSFQGSTTWYYWSSVEASVDYTAAENQNAAGGGDMASYLRDQFGSNIDGNDLLSLMEAYAPPSQNNTAQYIAEVQSWISQLVSLTTGTAASGSGASSVLAQNPSAGNCGCPTATTGSSAASSSSTPSSSTSQPTIVLDPGHGPSPATADIDPTTNINVTDWENDPEMSDVYTIAQAVSQQLTQAGYNVIITKSSVSQYVNLKQREDIANQANAALGVSIHTSPGTASSVNSDYYPAVGEYRILANGANSPPYSNATLAATDQKDAQTMATARSAAEGQPVVAETYAQQIGGGVRIENTLGVPQGGNILEADYFANVPWVYNEQWQDGGQDPGGIDPATGHPENGNHLAASTMTNYENGLVKGIEQIVPTSGSGSGSDSANGSCSGGSGTIAQTAVSLAWPSPFTSPSNGRNSPTTPTPAYAAALQRYNPSEFTATGGTGDDCGVFVATVMRDSGADPNYPVVSTVTQANYVIAHPELYTVIYPATSTAQLQDGDILILNTGTTVTNGVIHVGSGGGGAGGHTFIYVGPQAGGYNEASASLGDRSGNLGVAQLTDSRGQFLIARLK